MTREVFLARISAPLLFNEYYAVENEEKSGGESFSVHPEHVLSNTLRVLNTKSKYPERQTSVVSETLTGPE